MAIEDEDTITLRRISTPANRGLTDLLLACPAPRTRTRRQPAADLVRHQLTLVTCNTSDFKHTGVTVSDPFA